MLENELFRLQQSSISGYNVGFNMNRNPYTINYGTHHPSSPFPIYVLPNSMSSSFFCQSPNLNAFATGPNDRSFSNNNNNNAVAAATPDVATNNESSNVQQPTILPSTSCKLSNLNTKKSNHHTPLPTESNPIRNVITPSYFQPNLMNPNLIPPNMSGRFFQSPAMPPTPPIVPHPNHHLPRRWKQLSNLNHQNMFIYMSHPSQSKQSQNQLTEEEPSSLTCTDDSVGDRDFIDEDESVDLNKLDDHGDSSINNDAEKPNIIGEHDNQENKVLVSNPVSIINSQPNTNTNNPMLLNEMGRYRNHHFHQQSVFSRIKNTAKSNSQSDRGLFYEIV